MPPPIFMGSSLKPTVHLEALGTALKEPLPSRPTVMYTIMGKGICMRFPTEAELDRGEGTATKGYR